MTRTPLRPLLAALALLVCAIPAVSAQDTPASMATVTLAARAGAAAATFTATDVSVYLTETAGYEGTPASSDLQISLSGVAPLDAAVLGWSSQAPGADRSGRDLTIVATGTAADGTAQTTTYAVTGARVTSFSLSHSSYAGTPSISLQVAAKTVRIDGVAMN